MNTTLESLPEQVRLNRLRNLAINITKYQNFKTSVILSKIDNAGLSQFTLKNYIDCGVNYIKTGKKTRQLGKLKIYIDECIKNCVQPLTPKQEEKRQIYKNRTKAVVNIYKKETTLPIQKVIDDINTDKNIYKHIGVKIKNSIIIQESEQEAKSFINGIKFVDKNLECKLIKISYEEI